MTSGLADNNRPIYWGTYNLEYVPSQTLFAPHCRNDPERSGRDVTSLYSSASAAYASRACSVLETIWTKITPFRFTLQKIIQKTRHRSPRTLNTLRMSIKHKTEAFEQDGRNCNASDLYLERTRFKSRTGLLVTFFFLLLILSKWVPK